MALPNQEEHNREERLYARVISTRDTYRQAKAEADALGKIRADLGLNHPDGRQAALKAARAEARSLQAYRKALQEFSAFILGSNQ